jgi:hypothetical protein
VANSAISLIARPYAWNSQRPARIMKKLREIARTHIEKAAAGDMQAIKELADRLDGKPGQILEHNHADSEPITKIVREIVHTWPSPEELHSEDGITFERSNGNGSGEPDS